MYCAIVWFVFSEFGLLKLFLLYYVPGSQCGRATSGIWALLLTPKPVCFSIVLTGPEPGRSHTLK